MKKTIKNLCLNIYSKTISNGMEVYLIPDKNSHNIYATYNVRYGGKDNDFAYEGKMITVPKGIAHFLEHKMFEDEDGNEVFEFYSKSGANANANTSNTKTTYLFSGKNNFEENLEYLLSYVEKPYFTDENVEKEKGIIIEELEMYKDNPSSRIMEKCLYNAFVKHPYKYPVIGTVQSVKSITKEDLYKCYNTFYNPSNIFIVISGNIDVNKTFKIIEKHENKRNIKNKEIIRKEYKEVDKVAKEYEEIEMDIKYPRFGIAYKINIEDYPYDKDLFYKHIMNAIDLKFGTTSLFEEELRNKKIINDSIYYTGVKTDTHFIIVIGAETTNVKEAEKRIREEMKSLSIKEEDFKRRIKLSIASTYEVLDSIYAMNSMVVNQLMIRNEIDYDPIKTIKGFNLEEINKYLSKLDLSNTTMCVVRKDK